MVTQKDQVVTGETAVFDTKSNLITMLGGVVLTQCRNVMRGDRLSVDMTTGVSRVESDSGRSKCWPISPDRGAGRRHPARKRLCRLLVSQINRNNINHLSAICGRRG
jgi:lipopolysaccharide export system protein LptA